jgi:hypothetical protein
VEACEERLALSAAVPAAHTDVAASGQVTTPGVAAEVSVPVPARQIDRSSVIVTETIQAAPGSSLIPSIVKVLGPNGKPLPVRRGGPPDPVNHALTHVYIRVSQPGPLTTEVVGLKGTTGAFTVNASIPGDTHGSGAVTIADLQAFSKAYLTTRGDALYNPAVDANHNGQVGLVDGQFLLRNETPLAPYRPLKVVLNLAPQFAAKGHPPKTSGGKTEFQNVVIEGHTEPGSIVFMDGGLGNYDWTGPALIPDIHGNFSAKVKLVDGLNNFNFLTIDPYGQQHIQDYPIFWMAFAAPGSKLTE